MADAEDTALNKPLPNWIWKEFFFLFWGYKKGSDTCIFFFVIFGGENGKDKSKFFFFQAVSQ